MTTDAAISEASRPVSRIAQVLYSRQQVGVVLEVSLPRGPEHVVELPPLVKELRTARLEPALTPVEVEEGDDFVQLSVLPSKSDKIGHLTAKETELRNEMEAKVNSTMYHFTIRSAEAFASSGTTMTPETLANFSTELKTRLKALAVDRNNIKKEQAKLTKFTPTRLDRDGAMRLLIGTLKTEPRKVSVLVTFQAAVLRCKASMHICSPTATGRFSIAVGYHNIFTCPLNNVHLKIYTVDSIPERNRASDPLRLTCATARIDESGRMKVQNLLARSTRSAGDSSEPVVDVPCATLCAGGPMRTFTETFHSANVKLTFFCNPELDSRVTAAASIRNDAKFTWVTNICASENAPNLLCVNVFRDGKYVHRKTFSPVKPGKKLWLLCGDERSVSVRLNSETNRQVNALDDKENLHEFSAQHSIEMTNSLERDVRLRVGVQLIELVGSAATRCGEVHHEIEQDHLVPVVSKFDQPDELAWPDLSEAEPVRVRLPENKGVAYVFARLAANGGSCGEKIKYTVRWKEQAQSDSRLNAPGGWKAAHSMKNPGEGPRQSGLFGQTSGFGASKSNNTGVSIFGSSSQNSTNNNDDDNNNNSSSGGLFGGTNSDTGASLFGLYNNSNDNSNNNNNSSGGGMFGGSNNNTGTSSFGSFTQSSGGNDKTSQFSFGASNNNTGTGSFGSSCQSSSCNDNTSGFKFHTYPSAPTAAFETAKPDADEEEHGQEQQDDDEDEL